MCPVSVFDTLYLRPSNSTGVTFSLSAGKSTRGEAAESASSVVPEGTDNMVCQAIDLLGRLSGIEPAMAVHLVKRIPVAAGLGGGSSDAAAALLGANVLWALGWPAKRLMEIASELGSDVPFFIEGKTAVCHGKGECVDVLTKHQSFHAVLVSPPVPLSTALAYARCRVPDEPRHVKAAAIAATDGNWRELVGSIHNRLEETAAGMTDWILGLRREFSRLPFVCHQMSGSGASYFGICRNARQAAAMAAYLRGRGVGQVFAVQSCG